MQGPAAMQPLPATKKRVASAAIAAVGGALVLIAVAFRWGTVHIAPPTSTQVLSVEVKGGLLAILLGVLLVAFGIVIGVFTTQRGALVGSIVALVVGALTFGVGLYFLLSKRPLVRSAASFFHRRGGGPTSLLIEKLNQGLANGSVSVSHGPAVYLAMAGGLLGVVAGLMGLRISREMPTPAPRAPGMPFPGTDQPTGGPLGAPAPPPGEPGPTPGYEG